MSFAPPHRSQFSPSGAYDSRWPTGGGSRDPIPSDGQLTADLGRNAVASPRSRELNDESGLVGRSGAVEEVR